MNLNLSQMIMEPSPVWNSQGPRLPPWFRLALSRIDKLLVLQFIPARDEALNDGVDPNQFPHGVWVICRKMRGTKWLLKRWIWSLSDKQGNYQEPGTDTIAVLRHARDQWRQGNVDAMERQMDDAILAVKAEGVARSQEQTREKLVRLCRLHNIVRGHSRVFMREALPCG